MDVDWKLANDNAIPLIQTLLPGGHRAGNEWVALCPWRNDKHEGSFSVNLLSGMWCDFADNDNKGDAVELYAKINNIPKLEAAKKLLHMQEDSDFKIEKRNHKEPENVNIILPVPDGISKPSFHHFKYGEPVKVWEYKSAEGKTLMYVARYYDATSSKKQFSPFVFTDKGWKQKQIPENRPLYNLDLLEKNKSLPVLIVEGEKCAENAQGALWGEFVVTTWHGGSSAVNKSNFDVLTGRKVYIWRDNDEPGIKAENAITKLLDGNCIPLDIPKGKIQGWDIADAIEEGFTKEELLKCILNKPEIKQANIPYRPLGYRNGTYYFLSGITRDVLSFTAGSLNKKACLYTIASLDYWEQNFSNKRGVDADLAANTLIQQCSQVGPFNANRLRGRGAWYDRGRVVLHLGDKLIVNDIETHIEEFRSSYIYESRAPINGSNAKPISSMESRSLIDLFSLVSFNKKASPYLLAGWCMISTICGSLEWRPHIWLTGPAGSGKSWIMEKLITPILGKSKVSALGRSTEAGIRQALNNDALPVIIDEAEAEEKTQKTNMQSLLMLMRQSSSDGAASILMGSPSGQSNEFNIRSCFLLSSIGVGTKHKADETRITIINLVQDKSPNARTKFERLARETANILDFDFCEGIRARAIAMVPVIRKNKTILSKYIATHLINSQRVSDQYGALLSGAYALVSDDVIDESKCEEFCKVLDDREDDSDVIEVSDHNECLQRIMQKTINARNSNGNIVETTIGSLIAIASGMGRVDGMNQSDADQYLRNHGIRYTSSDGRVHFANKHTEIEKMLNDTPWANNYQEMLRRIEGAMTDKNKITYGQAVSLRGTSLPIEVILPMDVVFPVYNEKDPFADA